MCLLLDCCGDLVNLSIFLLDANTFLLWVDRINTASKNVFVKSNENGVAKLGFMLKLSASELLQPCWSRFSLPSLAPSRLLLRCWRGWILWVLAPSLWTSRLSPRGHSSWLRVARPPSRTRATARASRLRSPSDQTSTLGSSSCESSHQRWMILLL